MTDSLDVELVCPVAEEETKTEGTALAPPDRENDVTARVERFLQAVGKNMNAEPEAAARLRAEILGRWKRK